MNLEKATLWTMEIRPCNDRTWEGNFVQKPTFYTVLGAILMRLEELKRALKDNTNDKSDVEWWHAQREQMQNVLQLWECIKDVPDFSCSWKQVKIAGTHIGSYRTITFEAFKVTNDA